MNGYIIGGGVVLALLGALVGLWYRYKYRDKCAEVTMWKKDYKILDSAYKKALADHENEIKLRAAELKGLRENERALNEKVRQLLSRSDPRTINNELNKLFPVPKEDG